MKNSVVSQRPKQNKAERPSNVRWVIVIMLFLFYTVNCIDRAALSVALPTISAEFLLEPAVQGLILSAFFWTYCLCQIPGGMAADKYGPRTVIGVAATVWGSFTALAGLAWGAVTLIIARMGLGAFESPYMPSASKLVSQWMPEQRRASGVTLIDSGAPLGSALGGLIVVALISATGSWRWSFIIVGSATVLIGLGVHFYIRNFPAEHKGVNQRELEIIQAELRGEKESERPGVSRSNFAWMVIGRIGWAMVFWGLVTWGPNYLTNARGLDLAAMGFATFIIFACGAAGEILSGLLVDRLQRTFARNKAFKILFGGSSALSLIALALLPIVASPQLAVGLLCIGVFFNLFGGLYWTIPGMLAKPAHVGVVGGAMNFAGTSSGIIVPIVAGLLVQFTGGYTAVLLYLVACAALYLVASLAIDFEGNGRRREVQNA